ncbi:MAG: hypothetical protein H7Z39_07730 [Burkholderiaceae bacterium]|nr:hypothetical protein [Burkholderiaceae bacterium]
MGQHAVLACGANETSNIRIDIRLIAGVSQEAIAHGVFAASAVFARYRADPRQCAAAHQRRGAGHKLDKRELLLCVIWDEACEKGTAEIRRHAAIENENDGGPDKPNNFQEKQRC